MNKRYLMAGLYALVGASSLLLSGCGGAADSNIPEEKPASKESSADMQKAIDEGLKGMGKTPK